MIYFGGAKNDTLRCPGANAGIPIANTTTHEIADGLFFFSNRKGSKFLAIIKVPSPARAPNSRIN